MKGFDVYVLTYGEHHGLLDRCLSSIEKVFCPIHIRRLTIGLNEPSLVSLSTAESFAERASARGTPVRLYVPGRNVGKYPLMRFMFAHQGMPCERIMWFDDDSHLRCRDSLWWIEALRHARRSDMVGHLHRLKKRYQPGQEDGIKAAPWYSGKKLSPDYRVKFATGGWWMLNPDIVRKWSWPFVELHHNSGDTILGELCRQRDYVLRDWHSGVSVNDGKRRGLSSGWIWENAHRVEETKKVYHYFDCRVASYDPGVDHPHVESLPHAWRHEISLE